MALLGFLSGNFQAVLLSKEGREGGREEGRKEAKKEGRREGKKEENQRS